MTTTTTNTVRFRPRAMRLNVNKTLYGVALYGVDIYGTNTLGFQANVIKFVFRPKEVS